jgi:hypothetical protein
MRTRFAANTSLPVAPPLKRLLVFPELKPRGIYDGTRKNLRRLVKAGLFPAPVRVSPNRIAWRSEDIEAWIASLPPAEPKPCPSRRDQPDPASASEQATAAKPPRRARPSSSDSQQRASAA